MFVVHGLFYFHKDIQRTACHLLIAEEKCCITCFYGVKQSAQHQRLIKIMFDNCFSVNKRLFSTDITCTVVMILMKSKSKVSSAVAVMCGFLKHEFYLTAS